MSCDAGEEIQRRMAVQRLGQQAWTEAVIDDGASGAVVHDDFEAVVGHAPLSIEQWTAQVGGAFK